MKSNLRLVWCAEREATRRISKAVEPEGMTWLITCLPSVGVIIANSTLWVGVALWESIQRLSGFLMEKAGWLRSKWVEGGW